MRFQMEFEELRRFAGATETVTGEVEILVYADNRGQGSLLFSCMRQMGMKQTV